MSDTTNYSYLVADDDLTEKLAWAISEKVGCNMDIGCAHRLAGNRFCICFASAEIATEVARDYLKKPVEKKSFWQKFFS